MKELLKELERIEKESREKLDDCMTNYLSGKYFEKTIDYFELMKILNNRYKDIKAINDNVKVVCERIKKTLEYKKSKKDEAYNNYMSSLRLKTKGDYYFAGLFEGEFNSYKEIIKILFGGDNDESNN